MMPGGRSPPEPGPRGVDPRCEDCGTLVGSPRHRIAVVVDRRPSPPKRQPKGLEGENKPQSCDVVQAINPPSTVPSFMPRKARFHIDAQSIHCRAEQARQLTPAQAIGMIGRSAREPSFGQGVIGPRVRCIILFRCLPRLARCWTRSSGIVARIACPARGEHW